MSSKGSQLEAGAIIGGYRIDHLIGRGGMGIVYQATNVALNRVYALKILAPELADDEAFRERFKREIRIAASLNHPNVIGIHHAAEHDGMLFLAMDFIRGTDLREVIVRGGALDPERAVDVLGQIGSALDAAHTEGLVHRDIKPANVLMGLENGQERAYLTDFGLAKRFDNATALTIKGQVVGTVDYMPPEQITGDPTDARSDIYALGCVLFEMLTGKVPYQRDNSVATLFAHVYEPPPSLPGPIAASHPMLGLVVAKAMAKEPEDRYFSAGDLTRDAVAALQGVRYTDPPTIVATGEARPADHPREERRGERTTAALEDLQADVTRVVEKAEMSSERGEPPRTASPRRVPRRSRARPILVVLAIGLVMVITGVTLLLVSSNSWPAYRTASYTASYPPGWGVLSNNVFHAGSYAFYRTLFADKSGRRILIDRTPNEPQTLDQAVRSVMKGAKPYVTLGVRSLTVAGRPTVEWEARFSRPYCTTLDGCVAADGRLGSVSLPVGDRVEYFQKIDGDMYGTIAAGWSLSSEATLGLRVAGSIRAG